MERIRLSTARLDFWVDVSIVQEDDRWVAVATLGGEPEVGLGNSREEAIREALGHSDRKPPNHSWRHHLDDDLIACQDPVLKRPLSS